VFIPCQPFFLSFRPGKRGSWPIDPGTAKIGGVTSRSNLTAARRTVRALRQAERVTEAHAGLCKLTETLAEQLDQVVEGGEKRYVVAQLGRAYLLALGALLAVPEPVGGEGWFQTFVKEMSTPKEGVGVTESHRWD
jgi:hypothetical protein